MLNAYREWTAGGLPEEVTSIGRTLQLPDLEIIPEIVRGKSFSIVEAAYLGGEAQGAELLEPLRELGPVMDTFAMVPPTALAELHMDPIEPVPYTSTHTMLGELTERALDEALAAVGPGAGSPVSFEIRHAGGALSRDGADHGAISSFAGEYLMFGIAPVLDPASVSAMEADMARLATAFEPDERRALPQLHRGAPRRQRDVPAGRCRAHAAGKDPVRPRRPLPRQPRYLARAERQSGVADSGRWASGPPPRSSSRVSFSCR